jgi:predicted restriction endonuclease
MGLLRAGAFETNVIMCEFWQLVESTTALHQGDKDAIDRLHDIWRQGSVTPRSIIHAHDSLGFDERQAQGHARVARIVLPGMFAQWIVEESARRGMPMTPAQAFNVACGKVDYGFGTEG